MLAVHHGFAPGRRLYIKLKSLPIVCNEDEHVAERKAAKHFSTQTVPKW